MRLALFAAAAALVLIAAAPPTRDQLLKIMHERHEGMEMIGKANKVLRRELTADAANLAQVRSSANTIATLAARSSHWFPRGTGPELGKTGAKPEIWKQPADFNAKLRNFQLAAKELQTAATRGDSAAVKGGYANLGKTCQACHDGYRIDMHH